MPGNVLLRSIADTAVLNTARDGFWVVRKHFSLQHAENHSPWMTGMFIHFRLVQHDEASCERGEYHSCTL